MQLIAETPLSSLIDRIKEQSTVILYQWLPDYIALLEQREIKEKTLSEYRRMSKFVAAKMGGYGVSAVDTRAIVSFLAEWRDSGKETMYNRYRSFLKGVFSSAISAGLTERNPVKHIKSERVTISRSCLLFPQFVTICEQADLLYVWARSTYELAQLTGQRLSDVHGMKWSDIVDGAIRITQKKTGMKLAIDTQTKMAALGKSIADVLDELKDLDNGSGRIVPASSTALMTNAFAKARTATGLTWDGSPPSFHEIRSLAARIYTEEKGPEYTQRILGHKSAQMTEKYVDSRGAEWIAI